MLKPRLIKKTRRGANPATDMTVTVLMGKPEGQEKPPATPTPQA